MSIALAALQTISIATAIASGCFWIKSARIKINWGSMATIGGPTRVLLEALNSQSRANAAAAWLAAIAAITAAFAEGLTLIGQQISN